MHKNYYASEYIKDLRDLLERGERNYGLGWLIKRWISSIRSMTIPLWS